MPRRNLLVAGLLALLVGVSSGWARQLPVRRFSTDHGMPHDAVACVERDSHGFVWAGTSRGLARFDGHRFEVFDTAHGLPAESVNGIIENPDGTYWVSSWWNGISLFDPRSPDPTRLFFPVAHDDQPGAKAHTLHRDRNGTVWIATTRGLWRLDESGNDPRIETVEKLPRIWNLTDDRYGTLWMATSGGLITRTADGTVAHPPVAGDRQVECYAVLEARDGAIWVGHDEGVTIFRPDGEIRSYGAVDGIGVGLIGDLIQSEDGKIWLAPLKGGLTEYDGERFLHYAPEDGLGHFLSRNLVEDSQGNIWIGSLDRGLIRMARNGVTAYAEADGLDFSSHGTIAEDRTGRIVVTAGPAVFPLRGERFARITPSFLGGQTSGRMGQNARLLIDRDGDWWFGTYHGLYRYSGAAVLEQISLREPERLDLVGAGLPTDGVSALFEDSSGRLWIGLESPGGLAVREPATGRILSLGIPEALPQLRVRDLAEDRAGGIWVGGLGGLLRYRDERFEEILTERVTDLYADDAGRLWIASEHDGVLRVDEPTNARPAMRRYTTEDGLVADTARGLTGDLLGRIYIGSNSGISRLDPETGNVRQYDTDLGLSNNEIVHAMRAGDGTLWFTSRRGVSRIEPRPDPPVARQPPDVRITAVRVAGRPQAVSALGQRRVAGLDIGAGDDRVEIDFGSLAFDLEGAPRYQYRLDGAQGDWTEPVTHRSINYARLAPGDYRFAVRAINRRGVASNAPAIVEFRVLRPFWQQAWFVTTLALLAAAAGYLVHRYRLGRALELERVRMRIATDLHDDLGSSLSQIAILSEVVRRRVGEGDRGLNQPLERIAEVSRELVDSMSDIVWAINPRRDRVGDLVQRMRRFASDTLASREIDFELRAPDRKSGRQLGADIRRQVYLVFKESVNNAARHSACARVEIDLALEGGDLRMSVVDDGRGFASGEATEGNGLESMRRRAGELGGELRIRSGPDSGTEVRLRIPLRTG